MEGRIIMPYYNGWTDPRSSYTVSKKDGKLQISGSFWHNSVEYKFSITEQTPLSAYPYRGYINAIAPDGKIMQMQGVQRRGRLKTMSTSQAAEIKSNPDMRFPSLNVTASINLTSNDEQAVKDIVAKKAEMLYGEHIYTIQKLLGKKTESIPSTFSLAVSLYHRDFSAKTMKKFTTKTNREHQRTLTLVGSILDEHPMAELRVLDIKRLQQSLATAKTGKDGAIKKCSDASIKKKLNLASKFWAYCREIGLFQASGNPFQEYMATAFSNKKNTAKLQRDATTPKVLSTDVEHSINHLIAEHTSDGRYIGIALVKDSHFSSADACKLNWDDVIFEESGIDYVRVRCCRDSIAGATHDFTRPCFPFCATILKQRYEYLQERYSVAELAQMPVVSTCKNPGKRLKGSELTAHCKRILANVGVSQLELQKSKGSTQTGVGVQLLQKNYKYKLFKYCGLGADPAAMSFLCGHSLRGDTTADHYRSFTCPEGQWYLYVALCRDTRFIALPEQQADEVEQDGKITLNPRYPDRAVSAVIECHLKKGETIQISAIKGVHASFETQILQ